MVMGGGGGADTPSHQQYGVEVMGRGGGCQHTFTSARRCNGDGRIGGGVVMGGGGGGCQHTFISAGRCNVKCLVSN